MTGSQDGTGSGYVYTWALATNSTNTLYFYTIETGDNQEEEEAAYCFVESFKLTGTQKEGVMMSAEWLGRQVATGTFTALTAGDMTSVDEMIFGMVPGIDDNIIFQPKILSEMNLERKGLRIGNDVVDISFSDGVFNISGLKENHLKARTNYKIEVV